MSSGLSFDEFANKSLFDNDEKQNPIQSLNTTQNSMDGMLSLKPVPQRQDLMQMNNNITSRHELGAGLATQRLSNISSTNPVSTQSSFIQSYNSSVGAEHDQRQLSQNVDDYKNVDIDVFPPLLITYKPDPMYPDGRFAPLLVNMGGELKPAKEGVPDLVLNFHNPSGAITVSVFPVKSKDKFNYMKLTMNTLYAMKSPHPVTVDEFLKIYSDTRTRLLNVISGFQ